SGFVNRVGYEKINTGNRFSWYGPPGALIEQLTTQFYANPIWNYGTITRFQGPFEATFSNTWTATIRGGWQWSVEAINSMQLWNPESYSSYREVRGTDTVPFTLPKGLHNMWAGQTNLSTPIRSIYGTLQFSYGSAPIFAEAAQGTEVALQAEVVWHP